jgi:hypothetical protein
LGDILLKHESDSSGDHYLIEEQRTLHVLAGPKKARFACVITSGKYSS